MYLTACLSFKNIIEKATKGNDQQTIKKEHEQEDAFSSFKIEDILIGRKIERTMAYNHLLKQAREALGLSQEYFAELLGTTASTISDWERGVHQPSHYLREKISAVLGKSPTELGLLPLEAPPLGLSAFDPLIPLPTTLVGRDNTIIQVRQRLQSKKSLFTVLLGLPGVGKTALAAALAHDPKVRRQFDGILWAGLGPNPNSVLLLSRWGKRLGIDGIIETKEAWMETLRSTLAGQTFLVIIDDAWKPEDVLFLQVGGPQCVYLITTRFPRLATALTADGTMRIEELSLNDGMTLLRQRVPQVITHEEHKIEALVQAVGGLPLALTLMGNYLRKHAYSGPTRRMTDAIERLNHADVRLQLSEVGPSADPSSPLTGNVFSLSAIIAIAERVVSEEARQALRVLATTFLAQPSGFSEEEALTIVSSVEVLDELLDAGFLEWSSGGYYTIHQTIADYAKISDVSRS